MDLNDIYATLYSENFSMKDKEQYSLCNSIFKNVNVSIVTKNHISCCLGQGAERHGMGSEESFGTDASLLYLYCDDSFMSVYNCQNSLSCATT